MLECIASYTGVYLSFNDTFIPTHGFFNINDIGSGESSALICNTNSSASGSMLGQWFSPTNESIPDDQESNSHVSGFVSKSTHTRVKLLRRTGNSPSEGIYHCKVNNTRETFQALYVGLYRNGSGNGMSNIIIIDILLVCYGIIYRGS